MKKRSSPKDDEMRPEYDFSSMSGGVRGKYFRQYRAGASLVSLDPEVAKAFPTDAAVNEALRTVLRVANTHRRAAGLPNKGMQQTSAARTRGRRAARS